VGGVREGTGERMRGWKVKEGGDGMEEGKMKKKV